MKLIAAVALLTLTATPVLAQTMPATPAAPAPATPGAAATAPAKLSIDSPIEQLVASPAAKAVVEGAIPGLSQHPSFDQFKAMTLAQVQPYSGGAITDEMIKKITDGLAAIK
ncbi:MAG: hypothetical protein B7Y43_08105 [Sphingomonas sp. 28-62-20]|uniref:hypothetical protein n=1 Tax=Sphingomonas sp. 28-62-20 TaxID=1970433 RepID=UPI000BD98FD4|nr:MAG: hypothetical protein B7Y43_08105 [Sphingomonas sp. 28-62-20]